LIDINLVLSHAAEDDEDLVESAAFVLYCVEVLGTNVGDGEEHGDFNKMKEEGRMKKMYDLFKSLKYSNAQRNLCLTVLYVHGTVWIGEKYKEMVVWLVENTTVSTEKVRSRATLHILRRLVFSLFFDISFLSCLDNFSFFFLFFQTFRVRCLS
jgi:hypothetical protein